MYIHIYTYIYIIYITYIIYIYTLFAYIKHILLYILLYYLLYHLSIYIYIYILQLLVFPAISYIYCSAFLHRALLVAINNLRNRKVKF